VLEGGVWVAIVLALVVAAVAVIRTRGRAAEHRAVAARASAALAVETRSTADEREVRGMILASMDEGVLLFDAQGSRVFANDAIHRHLGDLPPTVERLRPSPLRDAVRRAGYIGAHVGAEVETGAPTRWLRATAQPAGTDGSVLLVIRDVTEARRLEAVRRDFVANASHELKTPVAAIQAMAETLRTAAADDPDATRRFAAQLERDTRRLGRIVADLLDLSRLETGSERADRVSMDELVQEEADRRAAEAADAGVTVSVTADGVAPIVGSARDLRLLVGNLIENAIRYSSAGGSVHVRVAAEPNIVLLRVSDTGVGIPQRDLPRIFERFYRVDQARSRDTGGTGLGLAIVKHVCENHGGDIAVDSELGRGTTFEVRLPVAASTSSPEAR
jgi:two-component system sensor histidine kinase SenX3